MDPPAVAWLSGLIAGSTYLACTYRTEFAFNIPYHLACITLAITGLVLVTASYVSSTFTTPPSPPSASYIPLPDIEEKKHRRQPSKPSSADLYTPVESRQFFPSRRKIWSTFALFVLVTCTRLEMARWVITHSECARWNVASAIPFLLTLYLATRRSGEYQQTLLLDDEDSTPSCNRFVAVQWRGLIPSLMLAAGAFFTTNTLPGLRSTYICPSSTVYPAMIPQLQVAGTILDVIIILMIDRLVSRGRILKGIAPVSRLADPGWAALAAYAVFALAGVLLFHFLSINRYWYTKMPFRYVASAAKVATIFALASLSALQTSRRLGASCTAAITVFVVANAASLRTALSLPSTSLPTQPFTVIFALGLLYAGFVILLCVEASQNEQLRLKARFMRVSRRLMLSLTLFFVAQICLWALQPGHQIHAHPIETLIKDADERHSNWFKQARTSKTIAEAAKEYRKRYRRDPPPRFNAWYDYAKLHKSVIIDDFDSLNENLVPFWSLSPGDIRLRTFESISNPWNYIGGIQVRKGKLIITQNVPPTHRWMMEAIVEMIEHFVKWLPDMDLAFNLNDEPRSAVRYNEMQGRLGIGHNPNQLPSRENGDFQPDRSWIPVPGEPLEDSRYKEASFHDSFFRYGSVDCPRWSRARRQRHWDLRESCAECVAEHSLGQFIRDWYHAADPCHQPDLADNFGLHLSPNAFKPTNELMPVFSTNKAHGYHDILYPSPWNYVEKDAYAPSKDEPDYAFRDKVSTMYWRGSTTEGMATGDGVWKGMARQRLVHMFNNASESDHHLVLLPIVPSDPKNLDAPQSYNYRSLSPSTLHTHLSTSIGLVNGIDRCAGPNCRIQHLEFSPSPTPGPSFQHHWRYKYLFDLDGAGASGNFLPFLQSHSLPFKASLMREWWDPRVTAWKHFVPVDIRFMEVWSLLAYFAGWRKDVKRDVWLMRPHEREAERIASEGREWAGRVLRKEDMEVYFFRLLLEWGRLTDDRRDELGWIADHD